jgi:HEAT repeat protein
MNLSPIQLLREAIRAVPPLKYALGVVGLIAVVAVGGAFRIRPEIAVLGSLATLVLMVALLVFAKLTRTAQKHFLIPALLLMWSFLVLVVCAAGLLFSSTFFNWPMDFRRAHPSNKSGRNQDEAEAAVRIAHQQLEARNYEAAWKTLQDAGGIQADSKVVLDAKADVAMVWLRNIVVREPHTFTEVVDQLTPSLYRALQNTKGTRAADIQAHIGWAAFLRARENPSAIEIEREFRKALELDPQNAYARTMLAHCLMQRTGNIAEARRHFEVALATKRDSVWVNGMRLAALRWMTVDENKLELARVLNEMRKNNETLSVSEKRRLFEEVYWFGAKFNYLTNLIHSLPAAEHLATFEWLAGEEGRSNTWPEQRFVWAGLKEQNGEWTAALRLYQSLTNLWGAGYSEEVKKAIAHCKAQAKTEAADQTKDIVRSIRMLGESDENKRNDAVKTLQRIGKPAAPALINVLKGEGANPTARMTVLDELDQFEANLEAGDVVPPLVKSLKDDDAEIRWRAAKWLGALGTNANAAVPNLMECLKDADNETRARAALALGPVGANPNVAIPGLLNLMTNGNGDRDKHFAIVAIGNLGPDARAVVPMLADMLSVTNADDWSTVVETLASIGHGAEAAVPVLLKRVERSDYYSLEETEALGKIGAAAKPAIPAIIAKMTQFVGFDVQKDQGKTVDYLQVYANALIQIAQALQKTVDTNSIPALEKSLATLEDFNFPGKTIRQLREPLNFLKKEAEEGRGPHGPPSAP